MTGTISYRLPDALTDVGDGQGYAVDLLPVPALRPAAYSVEIVAPPGSTIDEAAPGIEVTGGKARYRAVPEVRTSLWVHLTPPER